MDDRGETRRAVTPTGPRRRFLSVWHRCCHVYGRMYRNAAETAYLGRCPRCGAPVRASIEPGGSNRRMFRTE
ncbi:MAG: hypothetical protein IID28_11290 [Planctomycetes bacterium]|nr:hypothetical protein [Planctomycetota bacterium]